MLFKAKVIVTLRKSILDVQGKAVLHALKSLAYSAVKSVRIGKYIELEVEAETREAALTLAESACKKLLANPIMEDFEVEVEELSQASTQ
ncbi:MAG: phosphoribosylformylglycinamidine synthase subunit PurS [Candidatus Thermochlorobacter sp.]